MNTRIQFKVLKSISKSFLVLTLLLILTVVAPAQDYWEQTTGPVGGTVQAMTSVNILSTTYIFAGHDGGVSVSTDYGASWNQTSLTSEIVNCLYIDSDLSLYAGVYLNGIFRTKDQGATWEQLGGGLPNTTVYDITQLNNGALLAATTTGLYRSPDKGSTWTEIDIGAATSSMRTIGQNTSTGTIIAGTAGDGLYRSTDNGASWTKVGLGTEYVYSFFYDNSSGTMFCYGHVGHIYASTDDGVSWTSRGSTVQKVYAFLKNSSGQLFATSMHEFYGGVYRSSDNGITWTKLVTGLELEQCWGMTITSDNNLYIGTYGDGIYKSTNNGDNWIKVNNNLVNSTVYALTVDNDDELFAGPWGMGVVRSSDKGQNWIKVGQGQVHVNVRCFAVNESTGDIFVGTQGYYVYRSQDNGVTWTQVRNGLTNGHVFAVAINQSTGHIYAGTHGGGFYHSTDNGDTWTLLSSTWNEQWVDAIALNKLGHIFVAADDDGIYRSTDYGSTWTQFDFTTGKIYSLAINSQGNIFAGIYGRGVWRSTNNGDTWEDVSNEMGNQFIYNDCIVINSRNHIFVGTTYNGVFRSTDNGESWQELNNGLDQLQVYSMALDSEGFVFVATKGGGVYKSIQPSTAATVYFSVRMPHVDGFNAVSDQVAVRGNFNKWGAIGDEIILTAENDEYMTYSGGWTTTRPDTVVTGQMAGIVEYKFLYLNPNANWESDLDDRTAEWDGEENLVLDPAWFNEYPNNPDDYAALEALYNNTGGTSWTNNEYWISDHPFSVWNGVTASNGRVNEILLNNNNLTGSLPPAFFNLTELTELQLMSNDIGGSIPSAINGLSKIKRIFFNFNNLSGSIPTEIGDLTTLTQLSLNGNALTDSIPPSIGNLTNLTNLILEDNDLSGSLPDQLYSLTNLTELLLDGNQFTGTISPLIGNLTKLSTLFLNNNQISGSLPTEIGNLVNMGRFRINSNKFYGPLPASIGNMTNLSTEFSIGRNQFSGELPIEIGNLTKLLYIDLSHNQFNGTVPDQITNLNKLETLYLYNNSLNGLPDFSPITTLVNLVVHTNFFTFEDLEPNMEVASNFSYSPQADVGTALDTTITTGSSISLKVVVGGANNQYQWYKDSSILSGETNSELFLTSVTASDDGVYHCEISNTVVTDLTLKSRFMTITVVESTLDTPVLVSPSDNATDVALNVTLEWNAVSGATSYYLQVDDNSDFTSREIDNTISTVTHPAASLSGNTVYYWRVQAIGESGQSNWSEVWKFTTEDVATAPAVPDLVSPGNGQTDVNNPPTLSWNASSGAESYDLQISTDVTFSSITYSAIGISQTSQQVTNLTDGVTYYWHVKANNTVGSSDWSDTWNFTLTTSSGVATPVLTEPGNGSTEIPIPAKLVWEENTIGGATYHVQVSTLSDFSTTIFDQSGITTGTKFVDGLAYSTQYFWRVRTTVNSEQSSWSTVFNFTTYAQQTTVSTPINFPTRPRNDDYTATDYRIFGLPGTSTINLEDVLGSDFKGTWTAYWDNGGSGTPEYYLEEFDGSSKFNLTSGKAFWIIYKGSLQINQQVNQADLNANGEAEIPLHPGYNLITCPFTFNVQWSVIQTLNGTTEPLYSFNGTFNESQQIEPYRGYYFFNENSARTVLRIPYSGSLGKTMAENELDWAVGISLLSDGFIEYTNRIGVSPQAEETYDKLDFHKPRAVGDVPGVYFYRPEWDENYSSFASDIRPPSLELQRWTFDIFAFREGEAVLSFSGIEDIHESCEIYLLDRNRYKSIDLRRQQEYRFIPVTESMSFEIVVGDKNAVASAVQQLIPTEFALGKNYPNPFNPTTTIPLLLPEKSTVNLTVYDMVGRKVKTVFTGVLETGKHFFNWDGTDDAGHIMSSGVYFCRMLTEQGRNFTGKMILIK
jgi:photosystem II stability/assembly factor-like uncharacterized protein/Leucine-rich repeat (LRR) protein